MNREEYREVYLKSDHWRAVRKRALERACGRCQVCNAASKLDVHHRTYERLGKEEDGDLTVLCRDCHDLFHSNSKVKSTKRKRASTRQAPGTYAPEKVALYKRQMLRALLANGGMTSKQLALATGYAPQVCSSTLVKLRTDKLVSRKGKRWSLTAVGFEVAQAVRSGKDRGGPQTLSVGSVVALRQSVPQPEEMWARARAVLETSPWSTASDIAAAVAVDDPATYPDWAYRVLARACEDGIVQRRNVPQGARHRVEWALSAWADDHRLRRVA